MDKGAAENAESLESVEVPKADERAGSSPNAVDDRPWKLAQLAATLAANLNLEERFVPGLKMNPRLSAKEFDPYFAAALKRADQLLSWAEGRGGEIHAYQLFEEGECLTEDQIRKVFEKVDWSALKSKQPVMDLMSAARCKFEEKLTTRRQMICTDNSEFEEIRREIDAAILDAFEHSSGFGSEEPIRLRCETLRMMVSDNLCEFFFDRPHTEQMAALHREERFFDWCFPDAKAGKARGHYRAHEIFRRCATWKWHIEKLVRQREGLSPSCIPYPPEDLRREHFSVFDEPI